MVPVDSAGSMICSHVNDSDSGFSKNISTYDERNFSFITIMETLVAIMGLIGYLH
jgi:H+/gluconate symporter-like permease